MLYRGSFLKAAFGNGFESGVKLEGTGLESRLLSLLLSLLLCPPPPGSRRQNQLYFHKNGRGLTVNDAWGSFVET